MKLTTILLIVTMVQVSAAGFAQKINFVKKNATLKQVFAQINKQTGYNVLLYGTEVKSNQIIDVNFKDASVDEVLKKVLEKQSVEYTIEEKTIFINDKASQILNKHAEIVAKDTLLSVTGRVLNSETGAPLQGATIKVKDGKIATTTSTDGSFKLNGIDAKATIVISFIGYINVEVKAGQSLGIIRLKLSDSPLNEVQVIAYGTESKRFSVGSTSTVSGETISRQPVSNPLLALQGQVPGLIINTSNGAPGARVYLQIRGQNTLSAIPASTLKPYDQPLFIIDGIPFARQNNNANQYNTLASSTVIGGGLDQAGGQSPFNNINPNDIESISVLKDADATSIYGSEGSNGVILITTKKGRAGKTTLNTTVNTQFNSVAKPVQLMNTEQYLQYRKDAFAADGVTPTTANAADLTVFDQTKYTNWQNVIYGKNTNNIDVNTTLQGGSVNNTFLISTGFNRSNVNFPGDFANQRLSFNSAFHNTSNDKRFDADFRTSYSYNTNNSPGTLNPGSALLPPNYPDMINADGTLNWVYKGVALNNLYGFLDQSYKFQNHNFQSSLQLSYKLLTGLAIKTIIGYNRSTSIENYVMPFSSRNPASTSPTTTGFGNNLAQTINIEPQATYTTTIGRGTLTALLGATYKKNRGYSTSITGSGYSNDFLTGSINGAVTKTAADVNSIRKYAAGFARINYNYAGKYIVSLTGRRDASSNFGPDRQFGNFGSVGGAWIFSEEALVKKLVPFMSFGKLSSNYGTSGSDAVGQYLFQTYWGPLASIAAPFQGTTVAFPLNHYNPDYSWSLKKSLNIGLDLGFFQDRILLNVAYYRSRSSNQLAASPLPSQTGFVNVVENVDATVQNIGWEFTLNTRNIQSKSFTWGSSFNFSFNRNKLLSFPNLASSPSYRNAYVVGQPISLVPSLFKYAGIDPATGLPQFYDRNGGITKTPTSGFASAGGDWITSVNRDAGYGGGLNNSLTYKQFRLDFFLQFQSQIAPNFLNFLYKQSRGGINQLNLPAIVSGNYWMKPGDDAQYFKLTTQNGPVQQAFANFLASDATYERVNYVRLKTVSLGYKLPEFMLKKLGIKSAMLNVSAQNLLTFSNVKVGDPENAGNYAAIPIQRVIALGANFNF